ncbi:zinc finger CCCH-type antiviral protein 1-like isoform X4 [Plectropomus leopardus]|uniref:zinc finger CCCH-type antiviral protein 1-like isoform X4 n=1 Tax=Plectropomus leopardus TaxID=160734 RepID=UPI001C4AF3E0|nr:zinc finger CCCH-type antiviral protein 1-like isoform X4 [Plectropomus leopardus]
MTFEPYIGFFSIFLFSFYLFLVLLPFVKFDVFLHLCADACRRVHFHLPYRWEVFDGISWTDVEDMEDVERDFCDPSKTQSHGDPPVHFPSMTQKLRPVRRLSTVSSDEKLRTMSVTSRRLEEAFLSDPSAEVLVVKGNREYVVSFTDMYQRNLKHHTKRRIRRRPHFVSTAEVENLHKNFDPMWI